MSRKARLAKAERRLNAAYAAKLPVWYAGSQRSTRYAGSRKKAKRT